MTFSDLCLIPPSSVPGLDACPLGTPLAGRILTSGSGGKGCFRPSGVPWLGPLLFFGGGASGAGGTLEKSPPSEAVLASPALSAIRCGSGGAGSPSLCALSHWWPVIQLRLGSHGAYGTLSGLLSLGKVRALRWGGITHPPILPDRAVVGTAARSRALVVEVMISAVRHPVGDFPLPPLPFSLDRVGPEGQAPFPPFFGFSH